MQRRSQEEEHEKAKGRHPELAEGSLGCSPGKKCFGKLRMINRRYHDE